ncbi:MAG: DNA recombination protein RmuC [Limisphaerales bacterium]
MAMPLGIDLLIALLLGGAAGFLAGWLKWAGKNDRRLENELREQILQRQSDLDKSRANLMEATNARAAAEANRDAAEKMLAGQKALQEKAMADLRDTFKALSADALKQSAPEFLRLAEQSFGKLQESAKGDLAQRQEAIKTLVEPLKQQLDNYQKRLQQSETAQSSALGEVKKQMETLSQHSQTLAQETLQFRMVLRSNPARGRWGEETLRRVVEAAGMSAHCDFTEQSQAGDGRPDLVVRLPAERVIIVDAKVPDFDFLNALESADPLNREQALAAHAAKLKAAIKGLADRDYSRQFANALDYVVLFLPAESLFSAALEGDRDLIVWAAEKKILLATPASLIALLRSVSVSWQQQAQTENAQQIAEAASELYSRVVKFMEHFEKLRAGLDRANSAFNDALASFQSRVRPAGERLSDLGGAGMAKEMPELQPLQPSWRLPAG